MIEAAGAEGETGAGRRRAWMFPRAVCRDAGEKTTRTGSGGAPRGVFTAPVAPSVFPMVEKKGARVGDLARVSFTARAVTHHCTTYAAPLDTSSDSSTEVVTAVPGSVPRTRDTRSSLPIPHCTCSTPAPGPVTAPPPIGSVAMTGTGSVVGSMTSIVNVDASAEARPSAAVWFAPSAARCPSKFKNSMMSTSGAKCHDEYSYARSKSWSAYNILILESNRIACDAKANFVDFSRI